MPQAADRLMRWLAGFTDAQTRTGRAKYGGAGTVDVTPKVGNREEARKVFGARSCHASAEETQQGRGSTWERRAWHDGEEPAPARGWRVGPFGCRNRGRPERGLVREGGNGRLGASRHSLDLDLTPEKRPPLQSQLTPALTCGPRRARALRASC